MLGVERLSTSQPIGEIDMDQDLFLTRKDGSTRHFRIYGHPPPIAGSIISLPIDGRLIEARVSEVASPLDRIDAAELEGSNRQS